MPSFLITGSSRGLGLEFAKQLLEEPTNIVIASARNPKASAGLKALQASAKGKLVLIKYDVTLFDTANAVAAEAAEHLPEGLDTLILNAGIQRAPLETLTETANWKETVDELSINAVAPLVAIRAFLPLLIQGKDKKIIGLSTSISSLTAFGSVPLAPVYSMSKIALNMGLRKIANEVKDRNISIAIVHPGWVRTEMGMGVDDFMASIGAGRSDVKQEDSVTGILKVGRELTLEKSGEFVDHEGKHIPW